MSALILALDPAISSPSFILGINEATTPFMVKDGNFITIIMPIVI